MKQLSFFDNSRADELTEIRRYAELEQRLGFTLSMSRKTLPEITGVAV